jgi:hypothetical protein
MKGDRPMALECRAARFWLATGVWLALVLTAGDTFAAKKDTSAFRWSRSVDTPTIEQPTIEAIVLDGPIFAGSRADFVDLRLCTAGIKGVAFALRQTPTTKNETVVQRWTALERGAKPLPPGGLEIFFDPPDNQAGPFDGITIDTPLRDFEQQVRVYSSADGQDWQPDYSRLVDVRSVEVPIQRTTQRHFRLVIDDVTAEQAAQLHKLSRRFRGGEETERTDSSVVERRPFRVDRIELFAKALAIAKTGVQTVVYPTDGFRVIRDPQHKQTLVEFSGNDQPLSAIKLLSDETNFSRAVSLEVAMPEPGKDKDRWRAVGSGRLTRFSLDALNKDELTLKFPQQRGNHYRLIVENGDSPPVAFTGVQAEGPEYQLVFLATPGQTYWLEYDWPAARQANYDTAAITAALARGTSPQWVALGPPTENPAAPAGPFTWAGLINDTWVVVTVMVVLSVILAWGLYRASRRIDLEPPIA